MSNELPKPDYEHNELEERRKSNREFQKALKDGTLKSYSDGVITYYTLWERFVKWISTPYRWWTGRNTEWNHVMYCIDGNEPTFYLNGVEVDEEDVDLSGINMSSSKGNTKTCSFWIGTQKEGDCS